MEDLNTMFQRKNYEILKNKLNLDITNNTDSLKSTIDNFIDLKSLGLTKYIINIYEDLNVKYKSIEIDNLLNDENQKIKDIFLDGIDSRKEKIDLFFEEKVDVNKISDEYLTKYHNYMIQINEELVNDITTKLREEVCINFSSKVVNKYILPNEETKDNLIGYISNSYCNNLIEKIASEVNLRNATLKNLSIEAFERFKAMNEMTSF